MTINEKIQTMLKIYTRIVTGIFFFLFFYLHFIMNDEMVGVSDIAGIHLCGIISAVAYLPLITDKEYSKTKMIVINVVHFLIVNITVLSIGYFLKWFTFKNYKTVAGLESMIMLIYAIMVFIEYKIDNCQAVKMNKKIQERNSRSNTGV